MATDGVLTSGDKTLTLAGVEATEGNNGYDVSALLIRATSSRKGPSICAR